LPEPHFENISEGFMVTLFARIDPKVVGKVPDKVPEVITENHRKITMLLSQNNRFSLSNLAQMIEISKRKILKNVNVLKDRGLLVRIGSPKSGYWQVIEKN
jgi:ATP-dependent DNA helicase RecG